MPFQAIGVSEYGKDQQKLVKNEVAKREMSKLDMREPPCRPLKKIINNPRSTPEEVDAAVIKLQNMPRDA